MSLAAPETENSLVTVSDRKPWQFKPGTSPNPGGRPKSLSSLVREQTKDGQELVRFMLGVLRGRKQPVRLRMEAAAWLADRGFGKALQQMELTGADGGPMEIVFRYVNDWRSLREREPK